MVFHVLLYLEESKVNKKSHFRHVVQMDTEEGEIRKQKSFVFVITIKDPSQKQQGCNGISVQFRYYLCKTF